MNKFYIRSQKVPEDIIALSGFEANASKNIFLDIMFTSVEKSRDEKLNGDYGYLIKDIKEIKKAVDGIIDSNDKINKIVSKRNYKKIRTMLKYFSDINHSSNQIFEIVKYWNFLSHQYNQIKDEYDIVQSNIQKIEKKILLNHTENLKNDVIINKINYYRKEKESLVQRMKNIETEFNNQINIICVKIEVFNHSLIVVNEIYNDLNSIYNNEMRSTIHLIKENIDSFETPSEYMFKMEKGGSIAILGYIDSGKEDDKDFWLKVTDDLYNDSVISMEDRISIIEKINRSSFQFAHILMQKLMNYGFDKISYYKSIKDYFDDKNSYKIIDFS